MCCVLASARELVQVGLLHIPANTWSGPSQIRHLLKSLKGQGGVPLCCITEAVCRLHALECRIMQLLCAADLERELFILRKLIEKEKNEKMSDCKDDFYICTFSNNTIVYKVGTALASCRRCVGAPARFVC